jgi:hypothetical protein
MSRSGINPERLAAFLSAHTWEIAELRQVITGGGWEKQERFAPVQKWVFADRDSLVLANEVIDVAREDAADTHATHHYRLVLLAGEDQIVSRKEWFVHANGTTTDAHGPAEAATPVGVLAQQMRHIEELHRSSIAKDRVMQASSAATIETLASMLQQTTSRVMDLETKRAEGLELHERLLSLQTERDIATKKLEMDMLYKSKTFERFEPVIPLMVNKLFKRPLLNEDAGDFDVLEAFILSLREDQMQKLQGALTSEQLQSFAGMWAAVLDRKERREKAKKEAEAKKATDANGAAHAPGTNGAATGGKA